MKAFGTRWHLPVGLQISLPEPSAPNPIRSQLGLRLDVDELLRRASSILPIPEGFALEEYYSEIVEAIRGSASVKRQVRTTRWFSQECRQARSFMIQALILAKIKDYMYPVYAAASRSYKRVVAEAKAKSLEMAEFELIMEAQLHPYRWLSTDLRRTACPIPAQRLREYFNQMFSGSNTIPVELPAGPSEWPSTTMFSRGILEQPFTIQEVSQAVLASPLRKAPGPDLIKNEHLRQAMVLMPCLTALFNEVPKTSRIPKEWRQSLLSVIPKGKVDPQMPSS